MTVIVTRHPVPRTSTLRANVKERRAEAGLLTGAALAIGVLLGVALGGTAIALYAFTLPLPLLLLWQSSDVLRADES